MEFLTNNFISEFFVIALKWLYTVVQDYSVAIIVLTVAIRLLILPLDLKQKKNGRKMAELQPKISSLKKRYANNPQMMQKKQQELFRKEGYKPLAGCLPMLLTMPLFFAFFGAMRVLAAEQTVSFLLNAQNLGEVAYDLPRWLWVHNFWQPDSGLAAILPTANEFSAFVQTNAAHITPQSIHMLASTELLQFSGSHIDIGLVGYNSLTESIVAVNGLEGFANGWFILPLLAGASLFVQQKLTMGQTPQAAGQGKFMLWFFPIFSIYICATANAAFAVYWLFANIYALGQTLVVNWVYKKRDEKLKKDVIEEAT